MKDGSFGSGMVSMACLVIAAFLVFACVDGTRKHDANKACERVTSPMYAEQYAECIRANTEWSAP